MAGGAVVPTLRSKSRVSVTSAAYDNLVNLSLAALSYIPPISYRWENFVHEFDGIGRLERLTTSRAVISAGLNQSDPLIMAASCVEKGLSRRNVKIYSDSRRI